jgi:hypothetical protein
VRQKDGWSNLLHVGEWSTVEHRYNYGELHTQMEQSDTAETSISPMSGIYWHLGPLDIKGKFIMMTGYNRKEPKIGSKP